MYQIYELPQKGVKDSNITERRLFFYIYHWDENNSFKNAAETWKKDIKSEYAFNPLKDYFHEREVFTEWDFKMAWDELLVKVNFGNYVVCVGHLFTHASKQTDRNDGLEFNKTSMIASGGGQDRTLKQNEIIALPKLNWHKNGLLILAGCNSGLTRNGWNPAQVFATHQGVTTIGQTGFAYFSTDWCHYDEINPAHTNICLWAFKRGKNAEVGLGARMRGSVFNG